MLNRARYGRRSEKLSPDQPAFFEAALDENFAETKAKLDALLPAGRKLIEQVVETSDLEVPSDYLKHETVSITVPETQCGACSTERVDMGTEEGELLEYLPGKFVLKKVMRQKM